MYIAKKYIRLPLLGGGGGINYGSFSRRVLHTKFGHNWPRIFRGDTLFRELKREQMNKRMHKRTTMVEEGL